MDVESFPWVDERSVKFGRYDMRDNPSLVEYRYSCAVAETVGRGLIGSPLTGYPYFDRFCHGYFSVFFKLYHDRERWPQAGLYVNYVTWADQGSGQTRMRLRQNVDILPRSASVRNTYVLVSAITKLQPFRSSRERLIYPTSRRKNRT